MRIQLNGGRPLGGWPAPYPRYPKGLYQVARNNHHLLILMMFYLIGATTDQPDENTTNHGVTTTKSYPCPPGYYCLSGDKYPTPCPKGRYNSKRYGSGLFNCTLCPKNTYNHLTAQKACFDCGGEATQPIPGQDQCDCSGLHRVFKVITVVFLWFWNQVILAGTLTGVQGDIRCKVLATLSTVKQLELVLALQKAVTEGSVFLLFVHWNGVHIVEVSDVCNWIQFGRNFKRW